MKLKGSLFIATGEPGSLEVLENRVTCTPSRRNSALAVVVQVLDHDPSAPGLSYRGLLTVALAAVVVVLLTIHRRNGPGPLARTMAEYTVVAVLAGLLAAAGTGVDQQPADHPASGRARTQAATGDDQSAVIRAATKLLRAGAALIRVVTGAAHWLVNLWRQADQQASAKGDAMAAPPRLSALSAPRSGQRVGKVQRVRAATRSP